MINIRKYTRSLYGEWNQFVERAKNTHFFFFRDYMEYHADRFEDHSLLFYENEKLVALLPGNIKDSTLYSHQGLTFGGLILPKNFRTYKLDQLFISLIAYCEEHNIVEVIYKAIPYIYHIQPAGEDLYFLTKNKAHLFRRDCGSVIWLTKDFKIAQGKKSGKNQAKKAGMEVREDQNFEDFFSMANENLEKKYLTTAVHSAEEMRLLALVFPENIKLYGAYLGESLVAGATLFINQSVVHAQYLASSPEGKKNRAMDLLILQLLDQFKNTHDYFSFGISTENEGLTLNYGLLRQKEEYGAQAICHDFYKLTPSLC